MLKTDQTLQTVQTLKTVRAGQTVFAIMGQCRLTARLSRRAWRVEAALRERINAGEWQPDERLPSVAQLAGEYGVARSTVVAALRRMEADGLVVIVSNWGTFRR